jgi:SAM-dependent methyltransferase
MQAVDFYDHLAPFYHLIYTDWDASMRRQATVLDSIIKEFWEDSVTTVLDVACGIGTQALGLAQLGYFVTGSDLSGAELEVAKRQAVARGLDLSLSVADMREAYVHHQKQFDLVIACDNAVPHLLTDADVLQAFRQFYLCTRPGGGCLISVRDYAHEDRNGVKVKPYGLRIEEHTRYLLFQVWDFHADGKIYDVDMYFVVDQGGRNCETHVMRTQYYAVEIRRLMSLMAEAGFREVQRLDDRLFQPVILGRRPEE